MSVLTAYVIIIGLVNLVGILATSINKTLIRSINLALISSTVIWAIFNELVGYEFLSLIVLYTTRVINSKNEYMYKDLLILIAPPVLLYSDSVWEIFLCLILLLPSMQLLEGKESDRQSSNLLVQLYDSFVKLFYLLISLLVVSVLVEGVRLNNVSEINNIVIILPINMMLLFGLVFVGSGESKKISRSFILGHAKTNYITNTVIKNYIIPYVILVKVKEIIVKSPSVPYIVESISFVIIMVFLYSFIKFISRYRKERMDNVLFMSTMPLVYVYLCTNEISTKMFALVFLVIVIVNSVYVELWYKKSSINKYFARISRPFLYMTPVSPLVYYIFSKMNRETPSVVFVVISTIILFSSMLYYNEDKKYQR